MEVDELSEFTFFRFMNINMLTVEEQQYKDGIFTNTEQILDTKGMECDSNIFKIFEEQVRQILEIRKLQKKKKDEEANDNERQHQLDMAIQ